MNKKIFGLAVLFSASVFLAACTKNQTASSTSQTNTIPVVAAENFYGDIVKQLGGDHVTVTSILSDPNVDPHEYESNVQDGVAIHNAKIVVKNGLGYDTWMDKLLSASQNPDRNVITAGDIAPHKLPDNPHVWYGIDNMATIAAKITDSLKKADPADADTFDQNLKVFTGSLGPVQDQMALVHSKYIGTPIGLTETIYLYQTQPMGLQVLTPFEFEKAIAEGNDPPAASVKASNDQIAKKQVKLLIYNNQTVTPITTNLLNAAKQLNIPVVAVTETMPPNATYQSWMLDQLQVLQQNLPK